MDIKRQIKKSLLLVILFFIKLIQFWFYGFHSQHEQLINGEMDLRIQFLQD